MQCQSVQVYFRRASKADCLYKQRLPRTSSLCELEAARITEKPAGCFAETVCQVYLGIPAFLPAKLSVQAVFSQCSGVQVNEIPCPNEVCAYTEYSISEYKPEANTL